MSKQLHEIPFDQRPDLLSGSIKEAVRYARLCDELDRDEIERLFYEALDELFPED